MSRTGLLHLLPVFLGVSLLWGCHSAPKEEEYPKDPLLMSKKPIEGPLVGEETEMTARSEPATPPLPPTAYVSTPPKTGPIASQEVTMPAIPIPSHRGPVNAVPAVRSRERPEAPFGPPGGARAAGTFGHAPDYSWLQGVLDKHYHGHLNLRYCDPTVEDTWGGKVCLESDSRLEQFHEGDVVVVEGVLIPDNNPSTQGNWRPYPRFRIYNIWLIQRKN
jgi:hypothetical protein